MPATTKVAHPPYNGASFDGKKYRTAFESGLAAFNARRASLTMWDSGTGQRVEWEIHRDGKPHEVVMASPEPRLQPRDLNLQSAVYVKDREDLACFGLDWKQRPVCKTALLAHLEEAWHAPFQSLLLSSLRAGSRWRGILAYVDAPDLSCQREELYRLQQFVAIATSESDLFEIVSHIVRADERRRIARDLHDGVMQSLIATEIQLALLKRDSLAPAGSPDSALKDAHELLRREIRNLRVQMEDLHQGGTSEVISRKCEELLTNARGVPPALPGRQSDFEDSGSIPLAVALCSCKSQCMNQSHRGCCFLLLTVLQFQSDENAPRRNGIPR